MTHLYSNLELIQKPNIQGFSDSRLISQSDKAKGEIQKLEACLEKMIDDSDQTKEEVQANFPVKHHFAPGVYAREILLPADSVCVGKLHKHSHLNIISSGKVRVTTEAGTETLTGPCTFTSYVGTKRSVYAIEDTVWTTIHVTDKTDLAEIEKEVIAETYEDLPKIEVKP